MKKQPAVLLILLAFVLVVGTLVYLKYSSRQDKVIFNPQTTGSPVSKLKMYKSLELDFSTQLPTSYIVDVKFTHLDLKNTTGSIGVDRNAHTFASLKEYLADVDDRDQLPSVNIIKEFLVNKHQVVVRDELRGGVKVRMYYIFTNDWVYVFSTESESLYSDLDQIVQSFQYTPN